MIGGRGKAREKLPHNLTAAAAGVSLSVESRRGSEALGASVGAGGGRRCCYLQQTFLSNNLEQMGEPGYRCAEAPSAAPRPPQPLPWARGGKTRQQSLPESFSPDKNGEGDHLCLHEVEAQRDMNKFH